MIRRLETTDGRYRRIDPDEWWDTTGIDLVDDAFIEAYLDANPDVGISVFESSGRLQ